MVSIAGGKLNRRGGRRSTTARRETRYGEIAVSHSRPLWIGKAKIGVGYDYRKDTVLDQTKDDVRTFFEWGMRY
jgi:sRNA-binding protein